MLNQQTLSLTNLPKKKKCYTKPSAHVFIFPSVFLGWALTDSWTTALWTVAAESWARAWEFWNTEQMKFLKLDYLEFPNILLSVNIIILNFLSCLKCLFLQWKSLQVAVFPLLKYIAISQDDCFYFIIHHDKNWHNLELDCLLSLD